VGIDIENITELYRYLESRGIGSKPVIIGIDGMYGIGKSNLAYCIGCKFIVPVINIDNFVGEVKESYKNAVALEIIA
jgi:dephospho-CoA kinase